VTALLPVTIEPGGIRYAPGVPPGAGVFATGHGHGRFAGGMAPEVIDESAPRHGLPKHKKEAQRIFANFAKVLKAGGTDRKHVVRVDQYYTGGQVVPAYHEVRREFFAGHVPPSTSNLHQKFLLTGQDMEVQLMAVVPAKGFEVVQHRPESAGARDLRLQPGAHLRRLRVRGGRPRKRSRPRKARSTRGTDAGRAPVEGTPIKLETGS
jgi:enamine deaminase RidA (YjgF/YER057c/UK114 family)